MRLFTVLVILAAGALIIRSRTRVEEWHVAADQPH